jgi:hypothetical protein
MSNETGHLPDQAGRDAESALESAAHILRASPRPAGTTPAREREILRRRQERDLIAWARENGRLIETPSHLSRIEDGGEEHRVWLDVPAQRYFKATHPGRFGFTVIAMPDGKLELTFATPLEYLERLLLQNSIFGDDLKLEGVTLETEFTVVLTSQANISGSAVTAEEICAFMTKLWFQPLPHVSLGRPGALAFYRDLDEVAVFDAHPGNFVIILSIDLVMVRAGGPLQTALEAAR